MATQSPQEHSWQGPLPLWSRLIWLLVFVLALVTFVYSLPFYYVQLTTPCQDEPCINAEDRPSPEIIEGLDALGLSVQWYVAWYLLIHIIIALVYCGLAALLIWQRPQDRSVWLFSLILVIIGVFATSAVDALFVVNTFWTTLVDLMNSLMWVGFAVLFYTFPDGRFVPAWSWLGVLAWLAVRASAFMPPASVLAFASWPTLVQVSILFGIFATAVFAQVYRYRRVSTPLQRQQTKWIVFGLFLMALLLFVDNLADSITVAFDSPLVLVWIALIYDVLALLVFLTLPVTLTIAILRYRLWDVDVLIRRTLIYGALTASLAAVYFGSIVILQSVFDTISGQERPSQLVTVLSTLAIAGLFAPLRGWLQHWIDRRFYRRKFDAEQVLAGFSATARNEVDLEKLAAQLVATVDETFQPATISLWLNTTLLKAHQIMR